MRYGVSLKRAIGLFSILGLMIVGIYLTRYGPAKDDIHIHLADGHGLETQDFFILIPILLVSLWLLFKVWQNRATIRAYIHREPEKALLIALVVGLALGSAFGAVFGAAFAPLIKSMIKFIHRVISP